VKRLLAVTGSICSVGGVLGAFALALVPTTQAAYPGKPGMIVFSSTFTGDREIFVAAPDGSGRVDLTRDPHADVTPSWSADGKRIAFASDRSGAMEIYLMNADGSGVAQVTHDGSFADHPHFTADGRSIVYESKKGGNWEIRRIGADGGGAVNLTRNRASDRYPATSPNGRLIAFSSNRGTSGTHIWVMNIEGRALRPVTTRKGNQFEPTWAPTGGRLAYVSGTLTSTTNIWTVLASGKGDRRLTALHGDDQINPAWSPDGHSLVLENCPLGSSACTLSVKPLTGGPVDISPLRAPLVDTFDGGDSSLWQQFQDGGVGAANTEANGKLTTTLQADSTAGGAGDIVGTHWGTNCRVGGDFDVQADYQLLEWPAANGVAAIFAAFDMSNFGVFAMRESQAWGEQYSSWIPQAFISQPTNDQVGTLRLQRQGSTAVVSYLSGANWVPVASGPMGTTPASITFGANSGRSNFSHQEVKVAWDNFRINSGSISCPTTWWEDNTPDWQAAPA
jgi:dipeptidyl aminopeptidase/acylaminoacyl peptidase